MNQLLAKAHEAAAQYNTLIERIYALSGELPCTPESIALDRKTAWLSGAVDSPLLMCAIETIKASISHWGCSCAYEPGDGHQSQRCFYHQRLDLLEAARKLRR